MTQLVKSLRSGQITIPATFREKLGVDKDTMFQIKLIEGELRIKPVKLTTKAQDTAWFKKLHDRFAEVRKETQSFSSKDIDQTIDSAIKSVRKSHAKSRS